MLFTSPTLLNKCYRWSFHSRRTWVQVSSWASHKAKPSSIHSISGLLSLAVPTLSQMPIYKIQLPYYAILRPKYHIAQASLDLSSWHRRASSGLELRLKSHYKLQSPHMRVVSTTLNSRFFHSPVLKTIFRHLNHPLQPSSQDNNNRSLDKWLEMEPNLEGFYIDILQFKAKTF